MDNCIIDTSLPCKKHKGKVRDTYDLGEQLLIAVTDRLSAFDRVLAAIPFKGRVLNQLSAWWCEQTKDIIGNHMIAMPSANVSLVKKCKPFAVEFIVRGYITGSTSTSLWTHYNAGERTYCGHDLPDGLTKNQKLPQPLLTPTTKETEHDRPLSGEEILELNLLTHDELDFINKKSLELFNYGQKIAAKNGLILVDTKYEFGKDKEGNIILIDEIHTPDSSRFWLAESYEELFKQNKEPDNLDKEIIRLWYKSKCDPYKDKVLPKAPDELIITLSQSYIKLYEMLTEQAAVIPDPVS
ncbi:MAG: phosphoribosylaminoimidazolesuccinocarboxamide synthase [Candidatus Neomarinimicrobiota bacterium]